MKLPIKIDESFKATSTYLLEVKTATGNIKSAKTILKNFDKYHVTKAINVGDYNIGEMGNILTMPH